MLGVSARVLLITDPGYTWPHIYAAVIDASRALGGLFAVQLRYKGISPSELRAPAHALRAFTAEHGASFVVNGSPELAADTSADGVHLPGFSSDQSLVARARRILGPACAIHVPVHDDRELALACDAGVDAILVSPIFDSPGKGPARGLTALERARAYLEHTGSAARLYALGGVEVAHAAACREAGADGVAIIRAMLDAADAAEAARALASPWAQRVVSFAPAAGGAKPGASAR